MSDNHSDKIPLRQFRAPRYWLTWLGISAMWLVAQLPFRAQIATGKFLGWLSYHLARGRRHVCEVNLRLCFPELTPDEHRQLVKKTFAANGIGLIEIAISWCANPERYRSLATIHGLEHIEEAFQQGKGILLLGCHLSCFEIAGMLYSQVGELNPTYRANDKNPLFNAFMYNGRKRHFDGLYERKDIRGAMRCLKQNGMLWHAPDQDYGAQHSVFASFFGIPAATITAGNRFAAFNDSPVLFFSHYRREDNSGYDLYFSKIARDYPSGDDEQDGVIINELVENAIRKQPDQYLWLHKRFKTSPPGQNRNPYKK